MWNPVTERERERERQRQRETEREIERTMRFFWNNDRTFTELTVN